MQYHDNSECTKKLMTPHHIGWEVKQQESGGIHYNSQPNVPNRVACTCRTLCWDGSVSWTCAPRPSGTCISGRGVVHHRRVHRALIRSRGTQHWSCLPWYVWSRGGWICPMAPRHFKQVRVSLAACNVCIEYIHGPT